MRRHPLMVLCLVALLCIAALAAAAETILHTEAGQPLAATLQLSATPLKSMTEIPFRFELEDAALVISSAACDLTMPAMPMPENRPSLECVANSCSGTAVFTMAGAWQVTFGLLLQNGTHASIVFDIDMVEMK